LKAITDNKGKESQRIGSRCSSLRDEPRHVTQWHANNTTQHQQENGDRSSSSMMLEKH